MNKTLLVVFILSLFVFVRYASVFFSPNKALTSAGHTYVAISFVTGLLSGLQLFGVYDFLKLLK